MTAGDEPWAAECPPALRPVLRPYLAGSTPVAPTLMRLLMLVEDGHAVGRALDGMAAAIAATGDAAVRRRLAVLRQLHAARPEAWRTVKAVLGEVSHGEMVTGDAVRAVAACARAFDRAVEISPEASVALYSFGDSGQLALATAEVVRRMTEWGLLGPERSVLEIGSGIGRFPEAIAGQVRRVIGIDISVRMVDEARRRCARLPNVEIRQTSGRDLAGVADVEIDTVLAIDAFPYLVLAGPAVVRTHVEEAARVLRPGGQFLILNYSYRGDEARDRKELAALAAGAGFRIRRDGTRPFALWDGIAYHLVKHG